MSQPTNDPQEFQNLPFEPKAGKYSILGNVKHASYVLLNRHDVPADLWHKHKGQLIRSYFEYQPDRQWDVDYTKFVRHMKDIKNPEQNPDLWVNEAQKLIPYLYSERIAKSKTLPPYQLAQFDSVLTLLSQTQALDKLRPNQEAFLKSHTFNKADLTNFFYTPHPTVATSAFPTVPRPQREQWFDLLLHFTIGAQVQPEAEAVKRCFSDETRLLRGFRHNNPCHGAGTRYSGGFSYWRDRFDKLYHKDGFCLGEKSSLRYAMVEEPDFPRAKAAYDEFLFCLNSHAHNENLLGHIRREPPVDKVEFGWSKPTWIEANLRRDVIGDYGPMSNTDYHTQEQADAAKARYEEAIQL